MRLEAQFGANITGPGYQWFDLNGLVGVRQTAGFTNPLPGVYVLEATPPPGAVGIYWNNATDTASASETFDPRLDYLDASTSSRATSAQATAIEADTQDIQARLPAALEGGRIAAALSAGARVALAAVQPDYAPSKAGDAMALTAPAQAAVVAAIEVELANDATGGQFMQAIMDKITATFSLEELNLAAIGVAARDAILNRVLAGNHDTAGTPGALLQRLPAAGTVATLTPGDVWSHAARTLTSLGAAAPSWYTAPDNATIVAGLATLTGRLTEARAAKLDVAGTLATQENLAALDLNPLDNSLVGYAAGTAGHALRTVHGMLTYRRTQVGDTLTIWNPDNSILQRFTGSPANGPYTALTPVA